MTPNKIGVPVAIAGAILFIVAVATVHIWRGHILRQREARICAKRRREAARQATPTVVLGTAVHVESQVGRTGGQEDATLRSTDFSSVQIMVSATRL